jgi:transcriptional regulator with XRE-family HTH domain
MSMAQATNGAAHTEAEWDHTQLARDIATWLIEYRHEHGLTQRMLAHKLGVSQPLIARFELGGRTPEIETLQRLSERLGVKATVVVSPGSVSLRFARARKGE